MSIRVNTDGFHSHTNGTHTPHKGKGTIDHVNCHFDLSNSSAKRKKARNSMTYTNDKNKDIQFGSTTFSPRHGNVVECIGISVYVYWTDIQIYTHARLTTD